MTHLFKSGVLPGPAPCWRGQGNVRPSAGIFLTAQVVGVSWVRLESPAQAPPGTFGSVNALASVGDVCVISIPLLSICCLNAENRRSGPCAWGQRQNVPGMSAPLPPEERAGATWGEELQRRLRRRQEAQPFRPGSRCPGTMLQRAERARASPCSCWDRGLARRGLRHHCWLWSHVTQDLGLLGQKAAGTMSANTQRSFLWPPSMCSQCPGATGSCAEFR